MGWCQVRAWLGLCVVKGGSLTFAAQSIKVSYADFPVIHFSDFADAAFSRSSGACVVATQRVLPMRPFMSVVLSVTETVLSRGRYQQFRRGQSAISLRVPGRLD